jgi:uncharacterized SAM-binding protein YcdF (DUF218 family)
VYGNALINKMAAMDLGIPEEDVVIFEENFRNTQDEALTLREYIGNNREIESIILVISKYYSKSAKKIFEKALNVLYREVDIYSSPSRYDVFNTEQWWKDREDIKWVILEYLKLANFCFREQILL